MSQFLVSKMWPELKEKVCAALESGEYKQCRGALRREDNNGNDCHCVMGVICDVLAKNGVKGAETALQYVGTETTTGLKYSSCFIPSNLFDMIFCENNNTRTFNVKYEGHLERSLSGLNDGYPGLKFPELSQLIREQM